MSKTTKSRRTTYIVLGVIALLAIAAFLKTKMSPKGIPVEREAVTQRTIHETVSASGKVFPELEVKIAADVSGEIVELYIKEGDTVKAGQVLAKIRPDELKSAVEQGEAAVKSAEAQKAATASGAKSSSAQIEQLKAEKQRTKAQLEGAEASFRRTEQMFKEGIVSGAEYDASVANLKTLQSGLASAEAALNAAEANRAGAGSNVEAAGYSINSAQARLRELRTSLNKTTVLAPIDGIITRLNVKKGERVVGTLQMAGTEIMRVADMSRMVVQVEVGESSILKVHRGDSAHVEVDAYLGETFRGVVTEIGSSASNLAAGVSDAVALNTDQVTNFIVKIRLNPDSYQHLFVAGRQHPFRPGMSASADIFTKTVSNVLSVPIIAVTTRMDEEDKKEEEEETRPGLAQEEKKVKAKDIKELVFVIQGDTVAERQVRTGIQDNDFIHIIEGLEANEMVVVGPYSAISRDLKQGEKVREKVEDDKKSGFSFGKKG